MSVTAQQIYKAALAPLYEEVNKDKDYKSFFLEFLNTTLQECKGVQNSILLFNELPPIASAPYITDFAEEVPYDDDLTRVAIPYNITSLFFKGDNKAGKSAEYRAMYIAALEEYSKAVFTPIENEN